MYYITKKTFPLVFWFWFLSLHYIQLTFSIFTTHSLCGLASFLRFHCCPALECLFRLVYMLFERRNHIFSALALFVFIFLLNMFISIFAMQNWFCSDCSNISESSVSFVWPNFFPIFSFFLSLFSALHVQMKCVEWMKTFVFQTVVWTFPFTSVLHSILACSSVPVTILKWLISEWKAKPRCCSTFFICIWMDAHVLFFLLKLSLFLSLLLQPHQQSTQMVWREL